jgi:arsenate reductase
MESRIYNVLFICTGNSARSIMAESMMNFLGRGRFNGYSAGSHPQGQVNPLALKTLAAMRLPHEDFRSKNWDEFAQPGAPEMDFVFTVCDNAAGEVCPMWPGQPMTAHWGAEDPAAAEGTEEQKLQVFRSVALTLKRRIELFLALPLHKLDAVALRKHLQGIGRHGTEQTN